MASGTQKSDKEQLLQKVGSSEAVQTTEQKVRPLQEFIKKFNGDWSMNLSGSLAYSLLLSTVPIITALLSILGLLLSPLGGNATPLITNLLSSALPRLPGMSASNIVGAIQQNLGRSYGLLGIFAVVSAIIFGSRLFVLLDGCFSIIYHVRPRSPIRQNLMAIGMFLVFIILVPIMALAASLPTQAVTSLKGTPVGQIPFLTSISGLLSSTIAAFILFEVIYLVVPNQRIRFRHSWMGALFATIAMQIYLVLFPLYVAHFLTNTAGAIGFTVILLVFFYYFAVILMLGAEVNAYFAEKVRPLPNDLATFVSTMGGELNRDRPSDESEDHTNPRPTHEADRAHIVATTGTEPDGTSRRGSGRRPDKQSGQQNAKNQRPAAPQSSSVETVPPVQRTTSETAQGQDGDRAAASTATMQGQTKQEALASVALGSILTIAIEMWRLRKGGK